MTTWTPFFASLFRSPDKEDWRSEYYKFYGCGENGKDCARFKKARIFLDKNGHTRELGGKVYLIDGYLAPF